MFDNLPRRLRFFEAFVSSSHGDLMDAIFDIDVPLNVTSMYAGDEGELGMTDSALWGKVQSPVQNRDEGGEAREGRTLHPMSPGLSPRRDKSQASRMSAHEQPPSSPLARLFGVARQRVVSTQGDASEDLRKIGEAMESLKEAALPGEKLRQEIKELSERQASRKQSLHFVD